MRQPRPLASQFLVESGNPWLTEEETVTLDPRTSEKRDGGRDGRGRRMSTRFYTCVTFLLLKYAARGSERGRLGGGRVIRALSSSSSTSTSTSEARSAPLPPSRLIPSLRFVVRIPVTSELRSYHSRAAAQLSLRRLMILIKSCGDHSLTAYFYGRGIC